MCRSLIIAAAAAGLAGPASAQVCTTHITVVSRGDEVGGSTVASITVTSAANSAPSFTKGGSQVIRTNAGPRSVTGWATAISPGSGESSQTVDFIVSNDNHPLFATQPAVSASGVLTFEPGPGATGKAAVTVHRSREEVQRLWESSEHRPEYVQGTDAAVTFKDAPGDRGTEIHVDLEGATSRGKPICPTVICCTGAASMIWDSV